MPNAAQFHLWFNHIPVIGSVFSLLWVGAALRFKNETANLLSTGSVVLTALFALPAFFTGDPASDVIRQLPGISKDLIHAHEEAAEIVIWIVELSGALALYLHYRVHRRKKLPRWGMPALFVLLLFCVTSLARVAHLGGQISHPEIRGGTLEKHRK